MIPQIQARDIFLNCSLAEPLEALKNLFAEESEPFHVFAPRETIPLPAPKPQDADERARLNQRAIELHLTKKLLPAHDEHIKTKDLAAYQALGYESNPMLRFAKAYDLIQSKYKEGAPECYVHNA